MCVARLATILRVDLRTGNDSLPPLVQYFARFVGVEVHSMKIE
jgi:hypothetical protein